MLVTEEELRQSYVDALADTLQELVCNEDTATKAKQVLADAVNSWYDYHYQELEKWAALKRLVERPL